LNNAARYSTHQANYHGKAGGNGKHAFVSLLRTVRARQGDVPVRRDRGPLSLIPVTVAKPPDDGEVALEGGTTAICGLGKDTQSARAGCASAGRRPW